MSYEQLAQSVDNLVASNADLANQAIAAISQSQTSATAAAASKDSAATSEAKAISAASAAAAVNQFSTDTVSDVGNRYAPIANLIRATGDEEYNALYGAQREIQYFAADEVNRFWYTLHENDQPVNLGIITRYPMDGDGINRQQESVALPDRMYGHQGLAVENLANNAVKLWCTDGDNKLIVNRFDYAPGGTPSAVEKYQLFSSADGFNTDVSCFDALSLGGVYVVGHAKIVGVDTVICRIWDRAAMVAAGPGDHSQNFLYEIDLKTLYVPSTFPIQGLCCDNKSVYGVSGGNGFTVEPRRCFKYDMKSGEVLEANMNFMVGSTEAAADGTGISYEPEGMQMVTWRGVTRVCVGIRSGSSLTPSVFRVHALGLMDSSDLNTKASGIIQRFRRLWTEIGNIYVNSLRLSIRAGVPGAYLALGTNNVDDFEINPTTRGLRPMTNGEQDLGQNSRYMKDGYFKRIMLAPGVFITAGNGSPEGVVESSPGSIYIQLDGTSGATNWRKNTGTSLTGWVVLS